MLTALSIRDIVLIEKLDLSLARGLTVLTGETGAGKSILLDSLGLALGARGDSALVRAGAEKGVVSASFSLPPAHAAFRLLAEQGVDAEADGELVIRRIQQADGKSRSFINDQPASLNLVRQIGWLLAEIHGQHDDRALVDVARHRALVDAFGGHEALLATVGDAWKTWTAAREALADARARVEKAEADRDYLEHATAELRDLDPQTDEEETLAARRQMMMNAEQFAGAISEAKDALGDDGTLEARLNLALRKLERRKDQAMGKLDAVCGALDRVLVEMAEAGRALASASRDFVYDPKVLEKSEERLFALRAAARKYKVQVGDLTALRRRFEEDMQSLADGGSNVTKLEKAEALAASSYEKAAAALSDARLATAQLLDTAVMAELAPLKLERARFKTMIEAEPLKAGASGVDRVEFLVSANPGVSPAPLMKVASGGELARFMLALKVVLAAKGSAPCLIFDEIDTGVGGAVADSIGSRLARLSSGLQVLCVTHSPQVAARADHHLMISKMEEVGGGGHRMVTRVAPLSAASRREEIARMLSGAQVTDEARAQADRLLAATG